MFRILIGIALVLHGLAHALPGMRLTDATWSGVGDSDLVLGLATLVWAVACAGFIAAGLGVLGTGPFPHRPATAAWAAGASLVLLGLWGTAWALVGIALDVAILLLLTRMPAIARAPGEPTTPPARPRLLPRAGRAVGTFVVAGLALLILVRPLHMRWGSTDAELRQPLPGDELAPGAGFQIQHAVTVASPPEAVWPWLAQLGHDRGGFYSYSRLENLFGLHVRNADRVHPEWQAIAAGDSVIATPDDYLGTGRRFGWRVARAEPGRVLVLENWGAFVLEPTRDGRTRLIVRTRGRAEDGIAALVLAPLGLTVFEPVHFVMERRMLAGIRARAEGGAAPERHSGR